jgi:hypothetical protein
MTTYEISAEDKDKLVDVVKDGVTFVHYAKQSGYYAPIADQITRMEQALSILTSLKAVGGNGG